MPYLTQEQREELERRYPETGAEVNYLICLVVDRFLEARGRTSLRYADFAEALAALEGAKQEFLRCVMDPYEEQKRQENGDVWRRGKAW